MLPFPASHGGYNCWQGGDECMRQLRCLIALGCLYAASGQPTKPPEFEAADVRVDKLDLPLSAEFLPSGQVTLRGITMKMLIGIGWRETHMLPELTSLALSVAPSVAQLKVVQADYLKGGPAWMDSDRFDVVAKAPEGTPVPTMRLMLQKLLEDRFHLVVHREEKVLKVYSMTIAKGGAKLKEAQGGNAVCAPSIGDDNVYHRDCRNMTMAELVEQLPAYAPRFFEGRPVVDATNLQGAWDFRLDWTPLSGGLAGLQAAPGQEFDSGTTIFATMEKRLGLKLEQREQPMMIIVIDRIDHFPTEN
jgi:uncharacterized protein (TIGR03435 family)